MACQTGKRAWGAMFSAAGHGNMHMQLMQDADAPSDKSASKLYVARHLTHKFPWGTSPTPQETASRLNDDTCVCTRWVSALFSGASEKRGQQRAEQCTVC